MFSHLMAFLTRSSIFSSQDGSGHPSPPFDAGHPDKASEAAAALMIRRNATAHAGIQRGLEKLAILGKEL